MNEIENLKLIKNYVALSLTRIMPTNNYEGELIHLTAVRFVDDCPKEFIDLYIENSWKKYDENLNKKAYPYVFAISCLHDWVEKDIIILHEGGRKDIEWLNEELRYHLQTDVSNKYINIEDLAIYQLGLKKTSLKNISKHFGVYRLNTNPKITTDAHNCMLIHEIWKAYKEE